MQDGRRLLLSGLECVVEAKIVDHEVWVCDRIWKYTVQKMKEDRLCP